MYLIKCAKLHSAYLLHLNYTKHITFYMMHNVFLPDTWFKSYRFYH